MIYSDLTRRYFDEAPNAGVLSGAGVFRGSAGNHQQGTWVQFDLQIASRSLAAARFLAFGCPHTIAIAAFVAEQAVGRQVMARLPESPQALLERFAVPLEKLGRILIIEDAWVAAATAAIEYAA